MAAPISLGRMIRKDIARSKKIASLSDRAGFLFCLIIPHLNSHGKMNGNLHYIKGEVCPLIDRYTLPVIEECMREINDKTNVKWFEYNGLWYIHSTNFDEHQDIRTRGRDNLPSSPEVVQNQSGSSSPEVELEVKEKNTIVANAPDSVNSGNGSKPPKQRRKIEYTPEYDTFWGIYPRHIGKEVAFKRFVTLTKEYPAEDIISSAKVYADKMREERKEEQYMLHPVTFLNQGRWKDYCFAD